MALIDHNQIEEVCRKVLEYFLSVQILVEILIVGEEDLADEMLLVLDGVAVDHDAHVFGKTSKGTLRLTLQAVPVREKQDASLRQHTAIEKLPGELKDRKCLAGARSHQNQGALSPL